ncbi:hypothetical protein F4859DRAFT_518134 [Xylaria cf. heliscus]|nr:hypothetical protein F4859DRAFT_518134 [Xylaria cf. heliscus]
MEFFNTMRANVQSRNNARQGVGPRVSFDYEANFYDSIDGLIWTAVHYVDGPMRPYMEKDPMFAQFCEQVESFEALFKADTSLVAYHGNSRGIPGFIRHYLHQRIASDLDWLDTEFNTSLEMSLRMENLNLSTFGVGMVLSLAIHLLQLIPLYGPTDGPDNGFYPGNIDHASGNNNGGLEYRSSKLVMEGIGNEPHFVWVVEGPKTNCYLAVSHRSPGSMDRCWLDPHQRRGKFREVKIDPEFRGRDYRGKTEDDSLDSDGQVIEEYDSPEKCLCVFHNEAAASAILDPSQGRDPAAHEGCLMMIESRSRTSVPIAHSEMYKLQASLLGVFKDAVDFQLRESQSIMLVHDSDASTSCVPHGHMRGFGFANLLLGRVNISKIE